MCKRPTQVVSCTPQYMQGYVSDLGRKTAARRRTTASNGRRSWIDPRAASSPDIAETRWRRETIKVMERCRDGAMRPGLPSRATDAPPETVPPPYRRVKGLMQCCEGLRWVDGSAPPCSTRQMPACGRRIGRVGRDPAASTRRSQKLRRSLSPAVQAGSRRTASRRAAQQPDPSPAKQRPARSEHRLQRQRSRKQAARRQTGFQSRGNPSRFRNTDDNAPSDTSAVARSMSGAR
jgi:hypothetical protein